MSRVSKVFHETDLKNKLAQKKINMLKTDWSLGKITCGNMWLCLDENKVELFGPNSKYYIYLKMDASHKPLNPHNQA